MIRSQTRRNLRLGLALLAIAAVLPVAWYLGSPLLINRTVDEGFPVGAATTKESSTGGQSSAPEPVPLGSGQFGVVDAIHKGEGTATLFTLPGGRGVLRLEDFRVTNGPDLYVYLSGHPAPRDSRQLHEGAALEVAPLKGNVGSQNYELAADVDLAAFKSVVIYCKRFSTVFSTAELTTSS